MSGITTMNTIRRKICPTGLIQAPLNSASRLVSGKDALAIRPAIAPTASPIRICQWRARPFLLPGAGASAGSIERRS